MNLQKKYGQYEEKRLRATNTQIQYFSNFLEKTGVDVKDHILKNWDPQVWEVIENILKGGSISPELKAMLKGWDIETRSYEEYLMKLFYAWFVEDYLYLWVPAQQWLNDRYYVEKGGSDSKRELLKANCATADPDLFVVHRETGKIIHLEVTTDNTGFTSRYNALDLRKRGNGTSKYTDLQAKRTEANVEKVFILMADAVNGTVTFLPINDQTVVLKEFKNKAWNDKECIRLGVSHSLKKFQLHM